MLGRGATSVVYLAEKTGSGKRYAVKVSICDREKLRREAFLLQKFSYPGIPCAVELLESGTKSFLVMEAVNGKSIGQRMRKGERFSSREILKTGIALSGILCYLHAQNPPVFYRDLKPDNVMITERGEIYLVDFGAAGTEETTKTTTATTMAIIFTYSQISRPMLVSSVFLGFVSFFSLSFRLIILLPSNVLPVKSSARMMAGAL